ncbi:hypothetical protein LXL04_007847 [Taraxacum kok-saghyz]
MEDVVVENPSRSFENSYIPENPRTPKPLTFSKNRLRGAKNRSNLRLVAKKNFRKNNFFFKKFAYMQKKNSCICISLYTTYLKGFVKKNLKKNAKKKVAYMQKLKKKVAYMQKLKKNIRILFILNVLEGSKVGFLKGITLLSTLARFDSISNAAKSAACTASKMVGFPSLYLPISSLWKSIRNQLKLGFVLQLDRILPFRFVCSVSLHARFMLYRFESNEIDSPLSFKFHFHVSTPATALEEAYNLDFSLFGGFLDLYLYISLLLLKSFILKELRISGFIHGRSWNDNEHGVGTTMIIRLPMETRNYPIPTRESLTGIRMTAIGMNNRKDQETRLLRFIYAYEANAASGMAVHDDCKLKFLELKAKRTFRYIIFKIEEKQKEVVVEKVGEPTENHDDFAASLSDNECRYGVFDYDFVTAENCQKSRIFFIAWSPDTARVRTKMIYASSKDRFKRELDGIQVELQATDPTEMDLEIKDCRFRKRNYLSESLPTCHIIPHLKGNLSQNLTRSGFRRLSKQLGIFQLHLVLTLPGELWAAPGVPSNFHNRDATLFKLLDLLIHDFHGFLHEVEVWVDLYFFQRNNERFVG